MACFYISPEQSGILKVAVYKQQYASKVHRISGDLERRRRRRRRSGRRSGRRTIPYCSPMGKSRSAFNPLHAFEYTTNTQACLAVGCLHEVPGEQLGGESQGPCSRANSGGQWCCGWAIGHWSPLCRKSSTFIFFSFQTSLSSCSRTCLGRWSPVWSSLLREGLTGYAWGSPCRLWVRKVKDELSLAISKRFDQNHL